jgi:hypothetical protein
MDMYYLVARDGRIRPWVERHNMGLFDVRTTLRAFRSAGLNVHRIPSRFSTDRGLYLASKRPTKRLPTSRPSGARKPLSRRARRCQ